MARVKNAVRLLPLSTNIRAILAIDGPASASWNTILRVGSAYKGPIGNDVTLAAVADGTWVPNVGTFTISTNPTNAKATSVLTLTGNALRANAVGTLTLVANPANTETVTIDARVYTFQTVLTNVNGNVLIGATASDTLDNLIAAITLGAGSGTTYAAATVLHATVTAAAGAGDTMTATAKTSGTGGNSIATTDGMGDAGNVWGAVTLENGATAETVTIGATVYTFVNHLTTAFHVLIGAAATNTLDNLIAAINLAAGAGTTYGTGTTAHPTVTAAAGAGDTMDITAILRGTAGNSIATTDTMGAEGTWTSTVMAGGTLETVTIGTDVYTFKHSDNLTSAFDVVIGAAATNSCDNLISAINDTGTEGTHYGTGTTEHTQVRAYPGAGDTVVVHSRPTILTAVGTLIATTETCAACAWAATTLADGTDGTNVTFVVTGDDVVCHFASGYSTVEDFEAALVADATAVAVMEIDTVGTSPLYLMVITDDDFSATNFSGGGEAVEAGPPAESGPPTYGMMRPTYADEALVLVSSEAGSGTMTATVTIWGWSLVTSTWYRIGTLNGGEAIEETSVSNTIAHAELLVGIGQFAGFAAELSVAGTGTEVEVWMDFVPPGSH